MKKLFTLLFAVGLVTAASAQRSDYYRNDNRNYNNSYQSSDYSNQYRPNAQWYERRNHDRYYWERRRAEQRRYEMMMMRKRARYRHSYPYGYYSQPSFQLSIGIGGRR